MNTSHIKNITFGVRYRRNFMIRDILGSLTEDLIRSEESPLNELLDRVNQSTSQLTLTSSISESNYLAITTDDMIFSLSTGGSQFGTDFEKVKKIFKFTTNLLFNKYKIYNVQRIGIVFDHIVEKINEPVLKAFEVLTQDNLNNLMHLKFRFQKIYPKITL